MAFAALLPVLGLAALGMVLAAGGALLATRFARRPDGAALLPVLGLGGLLIACALPFAWVAWFGRG